MNDLKNLAGDIDRALSRLADAVESYSEAASEKRKHLLGNPERVNDLHFIASSNEFIREALRAYRPLAKLIGWNYRPEKSFAERHPTPQKPKAQQPMGLRPVA